MTLEELAHEHRWLMLEDYGREVPPCSREAYDAARRQFALAVGFDWPQAYWQIMAVSNGIRFNGMTIAPAVQAAGFAQTMQQLNENLRASRREPFVCLGQRDDEMYGWDRDREVYCATERAPRSVWKEFASAQAMYEFLLRRGLDLPEESPAGE